MIAKHPLYLGDDNNRITSGKNLNDYTSAGSYSVSSNSDASGITNIPVSAGGRLWVFNTLGYVSTSYVGQIYKPYGNYDLYYRYKSSSWQAWKKLTFA